MPMKALTTILISGCVAATALAQVSMEADAQRNAAETREVAGRALSTFQKASREQLQIMGFKSAEELSGATVGEPFPVYMVGLESLKGFQPGSNPASLLKLLDKVVYPLTSGAETRSSITIEKGKEGWTASSIGGGNFAKLAVTARDELARSTSRDAKAFFLVQIPALNVCFVGFQDGDKLMLSSILDDPALKLQAGSVSPADQVFAELVPFAKNYNGEPM
jgi:hypothetical protein